MFYDCTSLNEVTCLATNISAVGCTSSWLHNVDSSGFFWKDANMSSWTTGENGIPLDWEVGDYDTCLNWEELGYQDYEDCRCSEFEECGDGYDCENCDGDPECECACNGGEWDGETCIYPEPEEPEEA